MADYPDLGIDFRHPSFLRKLASGLQGSQPLKKALLVSGKLCSVIDATAGRGHDAFLMAHWGFEVTAFERNPEVWRQLSLALGELKEDDLATTLLRTKLQFYFGDFYDSCRSNHLTADVVYLDPMYPPKIKSAASTKDIVALRSIVGAQAESLEILLKHALEICKLKVVLKRPLHQPIPFKPNHSFEGTSTRYDVFLKNTPLQTLTK